MSIVPLNLGTLLLSMISMNLQLKADAIIHLSCEGAVTNILEDGKPYIERLRSIWIPRSLPFFINFTFLDHGLGIIYGQDFLRQMSHIGKALAKDIVSIPLW